MHDVSEYVRGSQIHRELLAIRYISFIEGFIYIVLWHQLFISFDAVMHEGAHVFAQNGGRNHTEQPKVLGLFGRSVYCK